MLLHTGIQMDADTDNHSEERIVFSGVDPYIMKMVIIKPPVIYLFAGSMIILNPYIHPYIWVQWYKAGYSSPVLFQAGE